MFGEKKIPVAIKPPDWKKHHAAGLQAMSRGDATPEQQKAVLDWIINHACLTYDMPYIPESSRDTDFFLGRVFVGQQIVKLLNLNLLSIKENKK
jgi:hypothetical protein